MFAHPVAQFAAVVAFLVVLLLVEFVQSRLGNPITARRPCPVCSSGYCRHNRKKLR